MSFTIGYAMWPMPCGQSKQASGFGIFHLDIFGYVWKHLGDIITYLSNLNVMLLSVVFKDYQAKLNWDLNITNHTTTMYLPTYQVSIQPFEPHTNINKNVFTK